VIFSVKHLYTKFIHTSGKINIQNSSKVTAVVIYGPSSIAG